MDKEHNFFFFSSRRRHTRSLCDWSSDVCSSDLYLNVPPLLLYQRTRHDKNRPLLQVANPLARLEELYAVRDPLYRETAHFVVDGASLVASGIVNHLLREFKRL